LVGGRTKQEIEIVDHVVPLGGRVFSDEMGEVSHALPLTALVNRLQNQRYHALVATQRSQQYKYSVMVCFPALILARLPLHFFSQTLIILHSALLPHEHAEKLFLRTCCKNLEHFASK